MKKCQKHKTVAMLCQNCCQLLQKLLPKLLPTAAALDYLWTVLLLSPTEDTTLLPTVCPNGRYNSPMVTHPPLPSSPPPPVTSPAPPVKH